MDNSDPFGGLLYDRKELSRSNEYYHEIHPTEATEVDERLAEEKAKVEVKAKAAAEAAAAKVAAAAAQPATPAKADSPASAAPGPESTSLKDSAKPAGGES